MMGSRQGRRASLYIVETTRGAAAA
uniref:Uncharacterized protein n=1 Tax=Arundo donax TaxID=35708 RepID=A0A0A8ZA24_ARUDO